MESAGNAVIDFGRFCTGFLVVMGVGMRSPSISSHFELDSSPFSSIIARQLLILGSTSTSDIAYALWAHRCPGYGDVNHRGTSDIWDHHKLYDVLSRRARLLDFLLAATLGYI